MKRSLYTCMAFSVALAGLATAQHADVMPVRNLANPANIGAGSFDFDAFTVVDLPPQLVSDGDLEEPVPGAGLLAGEFGIAAVSATVAQAQLAGSGYSNLPGGVTLRVDFRSFPLGGAGPANLWYWDGVDANGNGDYSDDIHFSPVSGVTLSIEANGGAQSAHLNGANSNVAGFEIGTTLFDNPGTMDDETGFLHQDLDALLEPNVAGGPVPLGIYVLGYGLSYPGAASDELFRIYNGGLGPAGEPAVEAAAEYVPEPASALGFGLFGALLLVRRRA